MKKLLALSFLLVTPLLGQDATDSSASTPTEILENSDMSDGTTHWHGNAKFAGAESSTDLVTSPSSAKGITVDLHPTTWTKVSQEVRGLKIHLSGRQLALPTLQVTIVYQTTPDFTLSTKETDYVDLGPSLDFEKTSIRGHPGQVMAFINYPISQPLVSGGYAPGERAASTFFTPKTDQQPQTFTGTINFTNVIRTSDMTFCLAFPPGTGSVTLTRISLVEVPPTPKPQQ